MRPATPLKLAYSSAPSPTVAAQTLPALWASGEKIPAQAAKIHAPRVLVVDDEALVRWSLAETFGKAGYDVVEAGTSRAARGVLQDPANRIAAIVLDLKLPDGAGLDVLEEARLSNQFCPVIVITAYGSSDAVDRALTLGAVAIIPKPFDLNQLLDVLKRICPLPA